MCNSWSRFRAAPGLKWEQNDNKLWQLHREDSVVLSFSCESQAPTEIKVANSHYHPEFNLSQDIEVLEVIMEARMPVEVRCCLKVEGRRK